MTFLKVLLIHRAKHSSFNSIERIFDTVFKELSIFCNIKNYNLPYHSSGLFNIFFNIVSVFFKQANVIHVVGDIHYVFLGLLFRKKIITLHDCGNIHKFAGIKRVIYILFWYQIPILLADKITTVSSETKKELIKLFNVESSRIIIIPNCLSSAYRFNNKDFNSNEPIGLIIGTKENKNLEKTFYALKGIKIQLKIVGKLNINQKNILKILSIKFIELGNVSDNKILEIFKESDLLLFMSTFEGFGMPIIEAQAIGRVVITSNISSMPEVAGNGACLVNPFSIKSMRTGILKVISDRHYRETLIANGLINSNKYNASIIAKRYLALYEDVSKKYL